MSSSSAHNPLRPRVMSLEVEELRTPHPVPPRQALPPESFFQYLPPPIDDENPYATTEQALSKDSKLNQRKSVADPALQSSGLNSRYTNPTRSGSSLSGASSTVGAATSPPVSPRVDAQKLALAEESNLNKRYVGQTSTPEDIAKDSRLNQRYVGEASKNGLTNGTGEQNGHAELSDTKLNTRYRKNVPGGPGQGHAGGHTAMAQIARQGQPPHRTRSQSSGSEPNIQNMDQWLDNVFDRALDSDLDDLQSASAVANQLKGGGDQGTTAASSGAANGVVLNGGITSSTAAFINPPTILTTPSSTFAGPTTGSIPLGESVFSSFAQ